MVVMDDSSKEHALRDISSGFSKYGVITKGTKHEVKSWKSSLPLRMSPTMRMSYTM